MIENKHHHYEKLKSFLSKKFSASPDDTTYTYGGVGEIYEGEPDISWRSIAYVKDAGWICTHGRIYDASGKADGLKTPIKINGKLFDGTSDITTDEWGPARKIYISDGSNKSSAVTVNGGEDIILNLPEIIDSKVTRDSEGRLISETYPTKDDLQEAVEGLSTFFVYSGEDDSNPTLTNRPAINWDTVEAKLLHAGDYFVTTSGRVFKFEEDPQTGWGWKEITDFYLYECQDELRELKKKLDISGRWDVIPQTYVDTADIYVRGQLMRKSYLDVLSCPGFVVYGIVSDVSLYLPFAYNGSWTRTKTEYFREPIFVRYTDLSRIADKTIVVTNEADSAGTMTLILGDSPEGTERELTLLPGQLCVLKFRAEMISGKLMFYWEASEVVPTENWITENWI